MKDRDISKLLSLVLRHQPDILGIKLDKEGWTEIGILLEKLREKGINVSLERLQEVVTTNDKKRFSFNSDLSKIRASQGHSIPVDLGMEAVTPPQYLYHGTAEANIGAIMAEGIKKQSRQHVHLSADEITASKVGLRHGKPVVLLVKSGKMNKNGVNFYLSENKVWLTDYVAPQYLEVLKR